MMPMAQTSILVIEFAVLVIVVWAIIRHFRRRE